MGALKECHIDVLILVNAWRTAHNVNPLFQSNKGLSSFQLILLYLPKFLCYSPMVSLLIYVKLRINSFVNLTMDRWDALIHYLNAFITITTVLSTHLSDVEMLAYQKLLIVVMTHVKDLKIDVHQPNAWHLHTSPVVKQWMGVLLLPRSGVHLKALKFACNYLIQATPFCIIFHAPLLRWTVLLMYC